MYNSNSDVFIKLIQMNSDFGFYVMLGLLCHCRSYISQRLLQRSTAGITEGFGDVATSVPSGNGLLETWFR